MILLCTDLSVLISSIIIEDLKESEFANKAILRVYNQSTNQSFQTSQFICSNLLSQLLEQLGLREPSKEAVSLYGEYCHRTESWPRLDEVIKVLQVELRCFDCAFIIVDALDEFSSEKNSAPTLQFVQDLERLDARLLITSRHTIPFSSNQHETC